MAAQDISRSWRVPATPRDAYAQLLVDLQPKLVRAKYKPMGNDGRRLTFERKYRPLYVLWICFVVFALAALIQSTSASGPNVAVAAIGWIAVGVAVFYRRTAVLTVTVTEATDGSMVTVAGTATKAAVALLPSGAAMSAAS